MNKENEFPETLLSMGTVLRHLELNNNILNYELGYIEGRHNLPADIRMYKYRILPAIDRVCDNIDELKLIKFKANQLMADLQGQGRG